MSALESLTMSAGLFLIPPRAEIQHSHDALEKLTSLKIGSAFSTGISSFIDNVFGGIKDAFPALQKLKLVGFTEDPSRPLEPWVSGVPKITSLRSLWLEGGGTVGNEVLLAVCKKLPSMQELVILECDNVTWKPPKFLAKRLVATSVEID
jgi:hypothetical protein